MFNTRALVPLLENVRVAVYALDEMQEQLNEAAAYKLELDEWRALAENMAAVLYHLDNAKKNQAMSDCINQFIKLEEEYPL